MLLQKYNLLFQNYAETFNQQSLCSEPGLQLDDALIQSKDLNQTQKKYYEYKQDEKQLKIIELVKQSDSLNIFKQINFLIFELKSKKISDLSQSTLLSNNLRFLAKNNQIKRLKINLSNNPIGDIGLFDIIKQISEIGSLEKVFLILDYCSITDKTVNKIVEYFVNLVKLKEISLSLNSTCVTENSVRTFYEFFQAKNKTIIADFKCNNLDVERHRKLIKKKENKFLDKSMRNQNIGSENYAEQFGDWQVNQNNYQETTFKGKKQTPKELLQNQNQQQNQQYQQQQQQQQPTHIFFNKQPSQQSNYSQNETQNTQSSLRQNPFTDSNPVIKEQQQDQRIKSREEQEQDQELQNKYGNGFKLLQKSGYQTGKGLGKNNDGIVEPVQANKKQFLGKPQKGQKYQSNSSINNFSNGESSSYFEEKAQNSQMLSTFKDKGILEFKKTGTMVVGKQDSTNEDQISDENDEENRNPNTQFKQNSSKKSSTSAKSLSKGSLQRISDNNHQQSASPSIMSLNQQQPHLQQQQYNHIQYTQQQQIQNNALHPASIGNNYYGQQY